MKKPLLSVIACAAFGLLACGAAFANDDSTSGKAAAAKPIRAGKAAKMRTLHAHKARPAKASVATKKRSTATRNAKAATPSSARLATARSGAAAMNFPTQTITGSKNSTDFDEWLTAGDYRFVIQHEGLQRAYRVHVPARYEQTDPAPMLVALNANSARGDDGFESLMKESDYQGFIAVYPEPYAAKGKPAWHAAGAKEDAKTAAPVNDVSFIRKVVQNVFRQTVVNRGRIYAAGVADGGAMAYRLACDLPDVFRGVASVGGTTPLGDCAGGKPVTVFHVHARNDARVPVESAAATTAQWAQNNGCELAPRKVLQMGGAYCEAYTYCNQRTAVELCVTDTGGSSWPGAKAKAGTSGDAPSQAIGATGAMWAFLKAH
jgi:polyhydroxybutyrate depolymerase